MRLVQLRTFTGIPGEGDLVFVAPDNVGMVAPAMVDPPICEVWLKVGTPMLMVEGSAEAVAALIADDGVQRLPPAPNAIPEYARDHARRPDGVSWRA